MCKPNINELETYGFKKWGKWVLDQNDKTKYSPYYQKTLDATVMNVIYAFANNESVAYIGITNGYLRKRMNYHVQQVNKTKKDTPRHTGRHRLPRLHPNLYDHVIDKKDMIILYYEPKTMCYNGLTIDMVSGLEYPLQEKFEVDWIIMKANSFRRYIKDKIQNIVLGNDE